MKRLLGLVTAAVILCTVFPVSAETSKSGGGESGPFYSQTALDNWIDFDKNSCTQVPLNACRVDGKKPDERAFTLKSGSAVSFSAKIESDGEYYLILRYMAVNESVAMNNCLHLRVDEADYEVMLPTLWCDADRNKTDRSGNDIIPNQKTAEGENYARLLDYSSIDRSDFTVSLNAGVHTFNLEETVQDIEISEIYLEKAASSVSCNQVISGTEINPGGDFITVEGENYSLKSDSYIRGKNVKDSSLTPYETYRKRINTLYSDYYATPGQKVLWEFETENAGWYRIGINYQQPNNSNLPVFRKIEIDGKVPYSEWEGYCFETTGSNSFKTDTLKVDGEDAWIYLDKGPHTLSMTVTIGTLADAYSEILTLIDEMNELGSQIMKLTAGSSDVNRTWNMDVYMPDAQGEIYGFADRIKELYNKLSKMVEDDAVFADDLTYAAELLVSLADDKKTIPNNSEKLCRGDNSATNYLGSVLTSITSQGLSIDKLYIYGEHELKGKSDGFIKNLWESVKRFLYSFTSSAISSDYNVSSKEKKDQLNVWVGQTPMCVSILQQILDDTYNKENGTDIRLVVMPSEQKLILANAVGNNPDLVISSADAYKYAIRGAVQNLLSYEDFFDYYTKEYSLEALVPMYYNGGVYGITDSRSFSVLFYRKDTLNALGLSVPETWDDVRAMMPTLLRNSMNFSIPTAGSGSYSLSATSPFIMQYGGEIYSEDGLISDIDNEKTIEALTAITEFHTVYGVQKSIASFFNSFRYNQVPIGIAGYDFYLQLNMAAPELAGLWDIALVPGTRQEDGSIKRYYPANASCCFIFKNSEKKEEAWDFLKWWLSSDTQSEFSRRRQTGYGSQYLWNTANQVSFETLPFSSDHKDVIREQFANQKQMVSHPASYIVEREIGNIWNNVVLGNESLVDNINSATILCDREFSRKLQEFGFIDSNGKIIKQYSINALEELKKMAGDRE